MVYIGDLSNLDIGSMREFISFPLTSSSEPGGLSISLGLFASGKIPCGMRLLY